MSRSLHQGCTNRRYGGSFDEHGTKVAAEAYDKEQKKGRSVAKKVCTQFWSITHMVASFPRKMYDTLSIHVFLSVWWIPSEIGLNFITYSQTMAKIVKERAARFKFQQDNYICVAGKRYRRLSGACSTFSMLIVTMCCVTTVRASNHIAFNTETQKPPKTPVISHNGETVWHWCGTGTTLKRVTVLITNGRIRVLPWVLTNDDHDDAWCESFFTSPFQTHFGLDNWDDNGRTHHIKLHDVILLPGAPKNLVSISRWSKDRKDDCAMLLHGDHSVFLWGNEEFPKVVHHLPHCSIPLMEVNKRDDAIVSFVRDYSRSFWMMLQTN